MGEGLGQAKPIPSVVTPVDDFTQP